MSRTCACSCFPSFDSCSALNILPNRPPLPLLIPLIFPLFLDLPRVREHLPLAFHPTHPPLAPLLTNPSRVLKRISHAPPFPPHLLPHTRIFRARNIRSMRPPPTLERRCTGTKVAPDPHIDPHKLARYTSRHRIRTHTPICAAITTALRTHDSPSAADDIIQRRHESGVSVLACSVLCEQGREERPEVSDEIFVLRSPGRE